MFDAFKAYITKNISFSKDDTFLLAVSGGIDSCVMLDLFMKFDCKFAVAHCNFHLRGRESDRDELFVKRLVSQNNKKLHLIDFDTEEYAAKNKLSIEMAARELRYNWFNQLICENNYSFIATAHNMNDVAETFLLNLSRGTGLKGLTGIKAKNGKLIRPLLFAQRDEIEIYAKQNNISYVTDSSNNEEYYTRNKIRHSILPVFKDINPSFIKTLQNNIDKLNDAHAVYISHISDAKTKLITKDQTGICIDLDTLKQYNPVKPYLYECVYKYGFNETQIDNIIESINCNEEQNFFSDGFRLVKSRSQLIISSISQQKHPDTITITSSDFKSDTPFQIDIRESNTNQREFNDSFIAEIDSNQIQYPLSVRKWQYGDYMKPIGMKGKSKKISDMLNDLKLSSIEKEQCYVLESQNTILWLIGYRLSDICKLNGSTKNKTIIKISF